MPAWSFKPRFHAALANGLAQIDASPPEFPGIRPKRQTIRAEWVNGLDPLPGAEVNVWIAQRTPGRIFLGTTPPVRRAAVRIGRRGHLSVTGLIVHPSEITKIARADGFETAGDLFDFVEAVHGFPFKGYRYRW